MPIKIIDNKKVDMTEDEFLLYQEICKSYDRTNFKGSELFRDLFETDDSGTIVFLRPPSNKYSSMEVFLFIVILFQHQQVRKMQAQVDMLCENLQNKIEKILKDKNEQNISS